MRMRISSHAAGWITAGLGVAAVTSPGWLAASAAGRICTLGIGVFIVLFGAMALVARDATTLHWGLVVAGLAMLLCPWVAGFAADKVAWLDWAAGLAALTLGMFSWTRDNPPTQNGIVEYGIDAARRPPAGAWVGRPALVLAIVAVVTGCAQPLAPAAVIVTVGFSALAAVLACWSLLASDPTGDHLRLATAGLALFVAPWIVGFTHQPAAWTAWVAGFGISALGIAGYLRGQALDYSGVMRNEAVEIYRQRFAHERPSAIADNR